MEAHGIGKDGNPSRRQGCPAGIASPRGRTAPQRKGNCSIRLYPHERERTSLGRASQTLIGTPAAAELFSYACRLAFARLIRKYFSMCSPSVGERGCLQTLQWIIRCRTPASGITRTTL